MIYKTAIFDFDGTILDSSKGIINCAYETTKKLGIKIPPNADLTKIIGPPLKVAFMDVLALDEKTAEEMVVVYKNTFTKNNMLECSVYDGIIDILEFLSKNKIDCAIASVKSQAAVLKTVKHLNMEHYFKAICGSLSALTVIDKIDIIEDAMSILNAKKQTTLMIGDSFYDSDGAKTVGIDFCAVLWGFGYLKAEDVNDAKYIISKPEELSAFFSM